MTPPGHQVSGGVLFYGGKTGIGVCPIWQLTKELEKSNPFFR